MKYETKLMDENSGEMRRINT